MRLRRLTAAAVFCGVLAALSQIQLPMPAGVPLTLQTFAVALCGFCLGWRYGLASVAVYLALGAAGLPFFSSFGGGVGRLAGPTGGFLIGFFPLVLGCGKRKFAFAFAGLAACHLLGTVHLAAATDNGLWQAFLVGSAPYLLKDVLSVFFARRVADRMPKKIF